MIEEGIEHDKVMHKESALAIATVLKAFSEQIKKQDIRESIFRAEDYKERTEIFLLCLKHLKESLYKKRHSLKQGIFEDQIVIKIFEKKLNIMTDFSHNTLLNEYYLKMKKMLKSMFVSSLVAERGIFVVNDDNYASAVKSLSGVIPLFGDLIGAAGTTWNMAKKMELSKKLRRIADLAVNYDGLEDLIARTMTLLRRNVIISCCNHFKRYKKTYENVLKKWNVTKKLFTLLKKDALTKPEILATNDTHVVEGCMVYIIESKQVDLLNFPCVSFSIPLPLSNPDRSQI